MNSFNTKKVKNNVIQWIRDWFTNNIPNKKAVIGISGGKDSSIVAALCCEALGRENVIGVKMPCGIQKDIDCSDMLINYLGIKSYTVNIQNAVDDILNEMNNIQITAQTTTNLPARIRMSALFAVAQSVDGVPACTCNLSEDYVGYATYGGDGFGSFAPLANLTVGEVKAIGYELGLPEELIEKTPSDGLCGKTDEDNLGFTYEVLDKYIRTGVCVNVEVKNKIDAMHEKNKFKLELMPSFPYNP